MRDKKLREEFNNLVEELSDDNLIKRGVWSEALTHRQLVSDFEAHKKLVKDSHIFGSTAIFSGHPSFKGLTDKVKNLERKLKAILELLNIKEIGKKGEALKKGSKEVVI